MGREKFLLPEACTKVHREYVEKSASRVLPLLALSRLPWFGMLTRAMLVNFAGLQNKNFYFL